MNKPIDSNLTLEEKKHARIMANMLIILSGQKKLSGVMEFIKLHSISVARYYRYMKWAEENVEDFDYKETIQQLKKKR